MPIANKHAVADASRVVRKTGKPPHIALSPSAEHGAKPRSGTVVSPPPPVEKFYLKLHRLPDRLGNPPAALLNNHIPQSLACFITAQVGQEVADQVLVLVLAAAGYVGGDVAVRGAPQG